MVKAMKELEIYPTHCLREDMDIFNLKELTNKDLTKIPTVTDEYPLQVIYRNDML